MIAWRPILSALLLILFSACSTTTEQKPEPPSMDEMLGSLTEQSGKTCVAFRDIEGHQAVEEGVISVSTRRGDHYLVTTTLPCRFLRSSPGMLVSDSWGTLCRGTGTVVDDDRTCPVRHIYEFPSREAAMAALKVAQARREAIELIPDQEPQSEEP